MEKFVCYGAKNLQKIEKDLTKAVYVDPVFLG